MKILLYSPFKYNFLVQTIYLGLIENLSINNVFIPKFNNLNLPKYLKHTPKSNIIDNDEILTKIDNFDAIIFFNDSFFIKEFYNIVNKKINSTKIFIDDVDDFFIRRIYYHPEIKYYFKRELYKYDVGFTAKLEWSIRYFYEIIKRQYGKNKIKEFSKWALPVGISNIKKYSDIKPISVTANETSEITKNKKYNLSFVGTVNNPERAKWLSKIRALNIKTNIHIRTKWIKKQQYINTIMESKASLSLRGVGCDTWRYWDIPAYNSMLISQRIPVLIPHDFEDKFSALYFSNLTEFKEKFDKYVLKTEEWKEITRNGHKHFLKYHTPKAKIKENIISLLK